jgi:leader peptidase (prepilin peptidase)/N-methyltransferase
MPGGHRSQRSRKTTSSGSPPRLPDGRPSALSLALRIARGWPGRRLLAAAGAWLGIAALPQLVLLAALLALVTAARLCLAGTRLDARSALPFGPFLALAAWSIWLLGPLPL